MRTGVTSLPFSIVAAVMMVSWLASIASACPRDGTCGECHCADHFAQIIKGSDINVIAATTRLVGRSGVTQTVHVSNFTFTPTSLTINVGDTIHWVWDSGTHTVTSVTGSVESYNSGFLSAPSGTFDHTYAQAGLFTYYCSLHGTDLGNGTASGMSASVNVVPEPVSAFGLCFFASFLSRRRRHATR